YVLAHAELFFTVPLIYGRTQEVLPMLLVATLWYVVITSALSIAQYSIERHYSKGAVRTLPPTPLQKIRARPARLRPPPAGGAAPGDAPRGGRVEIRGVHKSFGDLEVLRGIDLTISPGSVTVILGPSGSGESTLLRTINHLETLTQGLISVDDEVIGYRLDGDLLHELREKDVLRQRTAIGMVFQSFNLFAHMTALANVAEAPRRALGVPRREAEARARELLALVGLSDKEQVYPRQLSGGQQ